MPEKTTPIAGQDGGNLTELLLGNGYGVHGMIRPTADLHGSRAGKLGRAFTYRVLLHSADLTDTSRLWMVMDRSEPAEVYHLAGQSHVQISFGLPEYTRSSTGLGTLRLFEINDALLGIKPL